MVPTFVEYVAPQMLSIRNLGTYLAMRHPRGSASTAFELPRATAGRLTGARGGHHVCGREPTPVDRGPETVPMACPGMSGFLLDLVRSHCYVPNMADG